MSDETTQVTLGGGAATELVNKHNTDRYTVDIGRGDGGDATILNTDPKDTGWLGNPFRLSDGYTRSEAVRKYRRVFHEELRRDPEFKSAVRTLTGETLACYCTPKACHGDVIVEYLRRIE